MELGRLVRINPRGIWRDEGEFNRWLVGNIDILAEARTKRNSTYLAPSEGL
ncbi:MAG: hypothetical protein NDF55_04210 [archaeon GB-1867-005]|nr:hypothetical protein [Candidatus Culexmicrobium cathedralense]